MDGTHVVPRACVTLAVFACAGTLLAQNVPVTGVRLSFREAQPDHVSVTIRNLRDQPLVTWKLQQDGTVLSSTSGRLGPGETFTHSLWVAGTRAASVSIALAVFADGYVEGQPAEVRAFREYRAAVVEDIRATISSSRITSTG